MDDFKRKLHLSMGWMANIKCKCCNPSISRSHHHKNVTLYNKMARAKLKVDTKKLESFYKEHYGS